MVTRSQADLLFTVLPVLGLIAGATAGWLARRGGRDAVSAITLWGGPLVLIGILWRVYNAITDRIGLDSVANLAVNFVLFVVAGGIAGLVWTTLAARRETQPAASADASVPEDGQ
jgi:hypothetical protein